MPLLVFGSITQEAGGRVSDYFSSVSLSPLAIIDVVIVAAIFYWLYTVLRDTRALGIIYGILIVVLAFVLAKILRLELLAMLLANVLTLLFVAIPVLFQPELRRLLERLGRTRSQAMKRIKRLPDCRPVVAEVAEAVRVLSEQRTGALIVFRRTTGLSDLSTAGVQLNADVSAPLLLNIFFDKSPLHDGAVLIDGEKIIAAGAMLPLSEREYGYKLGSRHRAAVGLTEQSDAVVLVVSEETGAISLAVNSKITPGINAAVLPQVLEEFLSRKQPRDIVRGLRRRAPSKRPPPAGTNQKRG